MKIKCYFKASWVARILSAILVIFGIYSLFTKLDYLGFIFVSACILVGIIVFYKFGLKEYSDIINCERYEEVDG